MAGRGLYAMPALMMPVLILFGFRMGVFTATEALGAVRAGADALKFFPGDILEMEAGDAVPADARLRFRVASGQACRLWLLSVDGRGEVSRLFPAQGDAPAAVQGASLSTFDGPGFGSRKRRRRCSGSRGRTNGTWMPPSRWPATGCWSAPRFWTKKKRATGP